MILWIICGLFVTVMVLAIYIEHQDDKDIEARLKALKDKP